MNRNRLRSLSRWIFVGCVAATLAACGGGGGDASPAPPPDARSGNYTLLAVNGKEYALALDFDANTYRVSGNGVDQGGSITASAGEFRFQPGNSPGAGRTSITRFTLADDNAVVGEVGLPEGELPFIAARVFETTLAGAAGRFNLLGRLLNADGSLDSTSIQQGEITAGGQMRTCNDRGIFEMPSCPASSVVSGTVTVAGDLYTWQAPAGDVRFRVARIGGDKVFLRASPAPAGATRFVIGTPAVTRFTPGTFVAGTSEPAWSTARIASGSSAFTFTFTVTGVSPAGVASTRTGTAGVVGVPGSDTRASLLGIATSDAGNFFAIRSTEIVAVIAARGNPFAPGFIALGKRQ